MKKQTAMNIIKFLDKVEIKGHKEREAMNEACDVLLEIVNTKEEDGKADAE